MRRNLFMLIILSFGFFNLISAQWEIKHIDELSSCYDNIIKFKNDSLGLFMGDNSVILKSIDKGGSWVVKEIEPKMYIKDFQFVDDSIVYAVGFLNSVSNIIKSTDNGDTWSVISSIVGKQLYSIMFYNNDSGIVAGYDGIYRTIDSGIHWDTVWSITKFGYKYGDVVQLSFPTEKIGYAIGEGRTINNNTHLFDNFLLKTDNAGLNWDTIKKFYPYPPISIHFINRDTGFIGMNSDILKTINGGETWTKVHLFNNIFSVSSIQFISDKIGFATGAPSAIIPEASTSFFVSKTNDGGESWAIYDTIGIPLNSIFFLNDTVGFVSGSYSLIMKTNGKINGLPKDYPWYLVGGDSYINKTIIDNSQTNIYPNPTNGILWIKQNSTNEHFKAINVIDFTGKIVNVITLDLDSGIKQLNLSNLPKGLYLVQIIYADRTEALKVLKE